MGRVAEGSEMIVEAINEDETIYKDIHYSKDQIKEISIAAWLHDIGKITTPEYVVDKGTKLETIYDRINTVEAKFEVIKKDLEIEYLKKSINSSNEEKEKLKEEFENQIKEIEDDFEFIKTSNTGGEFMADEKIDRINEIAKKTLIINNNEINLLS